MDWIVPDAEHPGPAAEKAASLLARGGVIIFPAERLYGIGADATNEEAVRRVFKLKGRSQAMPLPVIVEDLRAAEQWVEIPGPARELIKKFWPGPLTLVLPMKGRAPRPLFMGLGSLGIRVPGNRLAREIAQKLGAPFTATSANPSGASPGRTAEEALAGLAGEVDLVLDAGELPGPPGSTVIKFGTDGLKILRPGILSREALEQEIQKEKKS
ncbi:MAG TPA: L-threonylcarbamoyladenylate synthase [bacterium]|nr:L-threonylcarbamoyladenylate synthase [bacterium]